MTSHTTPLFPTVASYIYIYIYMCVCDFYVHHSKEVSEEVSDVLVEGISDVIVED